MDEEGDDKDDTKRRTRNLSEKKRRDQFNLLVTELSTLVSSNNRKMDKSTVLKSTISFLKNHNEVTVRSRAHDVQEDWKPAFLSNEEFTYLVLEALEGFVMVFSVSGRIHYVSESIISILGHNPVDIVNNNIFDLTFEEDRPNLYNLLQRNANAPEPIPNTSQENEMLRFQLHLRRGTLDFREEVSYDLVQFYGHFRTNQVEVDVDRGMIDYQLDLESRILFVSIARLHTPQLIRDVSLVDSSRSEFTSRHSLEWKFLFLDHRAPPIIGYLPFEVLGTSGYDYYHFDDLEKVVSCHEALMEKGELTSCYYRFLTKGQQWIWLQTRFYITYHQWNSKPEFVVCTHRVVSYADVINTTKEEDVEQDNDLSEAEGNQHHLVRDTSTDGPLPPVSPSYISEAASDGFGNSYQHISQTPTMKDSPPKVDMPVLSPSYTSVAATDGFGNSFQLVSQNTLKIPTFEEPALSPSYMSERSDSFANSYPPMSQNILKTPPSEGCPALSPYMPEINDASNSYRPIVQNTLKIPLSEERPGLSPSYLSERSDSFANTYPSSSRNTLTIPTAERAGLSPSYMSERSDSFANSYAPVSQNSIKDPPSDEEQPPLSPSYMSEAASDAVWNSYHPSSQPASVKSASVGSTAGTIATAATIGASWSRARGRYAAGSDTASVSGGSRSSQRNSERESHKPSESVAPQHGIGAQYLDPSPYVAGVAVPAGMLPLSTLPVLVTAEQAQIQWPWQEQLQRKHEELQQMIVRQQEELRQVKEQLLLARLGILQPLINVPNPYSTAEEIQNQQRLTQLAYANATPRASIAGYPPHVSLPPLTTLQPHPLHPPLTPLPPHASDPHQHMPQ